MLNNKTISFVSRRPLKIYNLKTSFSDDEYNNKNHNNYRNSYYANKIVRLDKLLYNTAKLISSDDLKGVIHRKWGHDTNVNIITVNNNDYFEINKDLIDNYDIVTNKLLEINMSDYILKIIRDYPLLDGPSENKNIYISLNFNSFKN
jgi:hypothetical protein